MKSLRITVAALACLAISSPAWADDVQSLLSAQGCFACHSIDSQMVGPSFKMVADRYRGQPGAEDMLAKKIIAGGNGHWDKETGGVMMPPHPGMSMEQAKEVAEWVLAVK